MYEPGPAGEARNLYASAPLESLVDRIPDDPRASAAFIREIREMVRQDELRAYAVISVPDRDEVLTDMAHEMRNPSFERVMKAYLASEDPGAKDNARAEIARLVDEFNDGVKAKLDQSRGAAADLVAARRREQIARYDAGIAERTAHAADSKRVPEERDALKAAGLIHDLRDGKNIQPAAIVRALGRVDTPEIKGALDAYMTRGADADETALRRGFTEALTQWRETGDVAELKAFKDGTNALPAQARAPDAVAPAFNASAGERFDTRASIAAIYANFAKGGDIRAELAAVPERYQDRVARALSREPSNDYMTAQRALNDIDEGRAPGAMPRDAGMLAVLDGFAQAKAAGGAAPDPAMMEDYRHALSLAARDRMTGLETIDNIGLRNVLQLEGMAIDLLNGKPQPGMKDGKWHATEGGAFDSVMQDFVARRDGLADWQQAALRDLRLETLGRVQEIARRELEAALPESAARLAGDQAEAQARAALEARFDESGQRMGASLAAFQGAPDEAAPVVLQPYAGPRPGR